MTNKKLIKLLRQAGPKGVANNPEIALDLMREAADALEAQEWQPIETAPKNATEVIVLCGRKDIRLGWYFAPSSRTFGWKDQNGKDITPHSWKPLCQPLPLHRRQNDG